MLYTRKDIEKIYSNLVFEYINKGARIDISKNNYTCSEFDCHMDLIDNSGRKIIIYTTTCANNREAFREYDRGLYEICIRVINPIKNNHGDVFYRKEDAENWTIYKFFRFKNVYTKSEEEFRVMCTKENKRAHDRWSYEYHKYIIPFDMDLILQIVRRRNGYKRAKRESIACVQKRNGKYYIYINGKGTLVIG